MDDVFISSPSLKSTIFLCLSISALRIHNWVCAPELFSSCSNYTSYSNKWLSRLNTFCSCASGSSSISVSISFSRSFSSSTCRDIWFLFALTRLTLFKSFFFLSVGGPLSISNEIWGYLSDNFHFFLNLYIKGRPGLSCSKPRLTVICMGFPFPKPLGDTGIVSPSHITLSDLGQVHRRCRLTIFQLPVIHSVCPPNFA